MGQKSYKRISSVWEEAEVVWIKVAGVWKNTCIPWVKVAGVWEQCHVPHTISTDTSSLSIDWPALSYSAYCSVTLVPGTMSVSLNKRDTGDGIAWCGFPVPSSSTGNFSWRVRALSDNGMSPRSMAVDITDDADFAVLKTVTVTQQPQTM